MLHQTQLESNYWLALNPGLRSSSSSDIINTEPKWRNNSMHNDKNTHRDHVKCSISILPCRILCLYFQHDIRNITKLFITLLVHVLCWRRVSGLKKGLFLCYRGFFFQPEQTKRSQILLWVNTHISIIRKEKNMNFKIFFAKVKNVSLLVVDFVLVETAAA